MTLADTTFFVDLMNPGRDRHEASLARAQSIEEAGRPLYMSALTRFELFTGSERYVEPARERRRIQELLDRYPTLPLTPPAADRAGKIHGSLADEGRPIGTVDALVAATALEEDLPVLTRNADEFERVQGLLVQTY